MTNCNLYNQKYKQHKDFYKYSRDCRIICTMWNAICKRKEFSILKDLLNKYSDLVDLLKKNSFVTLFAPTNKAFKNIDIRDNEKLQPC